MTIPLNYDAAEIFSPDWTGSTIPHKLEEERKLIPEAWETQKRITRTISERKAVFSEELIHLSEKVDARKEKVESWSKEVYIINYNSEQRGERQSSQILEKINPDNITHILNEISVNQKQDESHFSKRKIIEDEFDSGSDYYSSDDEYEE
jgi:hypothetical protein